MNYELAKQLKDAGYKLELAGISSNWPEDKMLPLKDVGKIDGKYYLYPTLSEIIEACEREDRTIHLHHNELDDGLYRAEAYFDGGSVSFGGEVAPEEAVAKLWLKLKKNFKK